ncbi:hypothetical protein NHJ13734_009753 [Beauveria thailandica]
MLLRFRQAISTVHFNPPNQFIALIAGGDYALRNAKEGAEDDRSAAKTDLDAFNIAPNLDSLIGIASSGRIPYVLGGLEYARSIGCTTVGVVCVQPSAIATEGNADYLTSAVTGSESVTGSTRMKAGTATKLVLNMVVDLKATNVKLRQPARNILRAIGGQRCHYSELDALLAAAHDSTKLAAVMMVLNVSLVEAELQAVLDHFKEQFPKAKLEDLLSTVMMPKSAPQQPKDAVMDRTSRIARVAKTVLSMVETHEDADRIVAAGADKLAELAALLVLHQGIKPLKASLVLAGGLMQDEGYRRRIVGSVEKAGYKFQHIEVVDRPAMNGARFLLRSTQKLQ